MEKNNIYCSFCGVPRLEVTYMVEGEGNAYICDKCVALCQEKLQSHITPMPLSKDELPTPSEISKSLDDYVIGQDYVKKLLSVAVYNHYKRQNYKKINDDGVELSKANVLLIGPTGSGKTLLAQTLARILDVPIVIVDATTLTEAGYVGEDVENIIQRLMQRCDYDMERISSGIIYIDEIDKISRKSENPSITRDVSGEGVQQSLLKLIEGTIASVPPQGGRKHPHQEYIQVDTTNILFICGGAFEGLKNITERRKKKKVIGFKQDSSVVKNLETEKNLTTKDVLPEDLISYGLIPEFVGRLPVVGVLDNLSIEAMIDIFKTPKNSIAKQFIQIFLMENVELLFDDDAIVSIVEIAQKRGTGARGLRSVTEEILLETMFILPDLNSIRKIIVDKNAVENKRPLFVYKNGRKKRIPMKHAA